MRFRIRWLTVPLALSGIVVSGTFKIALAQQTNGEARIQFARYWRGEGRTLLEGIVGLPLARSTRNVELEVRDSTGKSLYSENWVDSASAQAAALRGVNAETATKLQVILSPGLYSVWVRKTEGSGTDSSRIDVRGFDSAPLVSDVIASAHLRVLAENEPPAAAETQRGRYAIERGTRVTVLPSDPRLWYYLELYRQGADSVADLEFGVVPEGKDSALFRVRRSVAVGARGTVDAAALKIAGLPPGDYQLVVGVKSGNRQERRATTFTMGSFAAEPAIAPPPITSGGTISETALYDRYFAPGVSSDASIMAVMEALTVGTPGERVPSENSQLTTDAKRRFLARYWAHVPDPTPSTPAHEMYDEYSARVRYVEREFREKAGRAGVKTDRGRIYLKYGPPDASQQLQIPSSSRGVVLWKYTRRKAFKYAFLDETGFDNYNLVYTTDPTERTLHDWQQRVYDVDIIQQIVNF